MNFRGLRKAHRPSVDKVLADWNQGERVRTGGRRAGKSSDHAPPSPRYIISGDTNTMTWTGTSGGIWTTGYPSTSAGPIWTTTTTNTGKPIEMPESVDSQLVSDLVERVETLEALILALAKKMGVAPKVFEELLTPEE